jgi:transcriptional regulator with XRE-family HTH domain
MSRRSFRSKAVVDINWESVGRRIREQRGFDVTQADLAQRIGVSQAYLSMIENGRGEIGAIVLLRLSREFNKSMEWILTGEE